MPLRLEDSPDFELVRNCLRAAGFDAKTLCARWNVRSIAELTSNHPRPVSPSTPADQLELLARFFVFGEWVEKKRLESALSLPVSQALTNLGLAAADPADASRLFCPVSLYPVGTILTVSDRSANPEGEELESPGDFVYPASTPNTLEFLAGLPRTPCDNFLELCSGAGAAALAAARYARHAWAVDITERSTQTAEFNRRLNGIENLTALRGDCYEGLGDLQFDRIVAHPPYVPNLHSGHIFYDGGQDGEQVTRRLVEGLPRHLRPGGRFHCIAQVSDRRNAPLEQRLRSWLGESQKEFDVAVIELREHSPEDAATVYALKTKGGYEAFNLMRTALAQMGIESLCLGWLILQRISEARNVFTARRLAGRRTGRQEIAWLLDWETLAATPGASERLQIMAPTARQEIELRTVHRWQQGELSPEKLALHTEHPFAMDCKVDPWMLNLVPLCDGKSTVQQVFECCKTRHFVHPETPPHEFAKLIGTLISGGFIEVADYPLPRPASAEGPAASTSG